MGESFLFEAIQLSTAQAGWPGSSSVLAGAVSRAGWQAEENPAASSDPAVIWARRGELLAVVDSSPMEAKWLVSVPDSDLRWADGQPDEANQAAVLELLEALLSVAPPYLGVSCWPFGPSVPEVYDPAAPFALRQVGSVMFLSERYLSTQLAGMNLADAPVWRRQQLGGGVLLVAERDLMRSAEYGELSELSAFFGLPPSPRR